MYTNDRLNQIYEKTDGYCHLCHRKLSFKNYGANGLKGSWHVEHSVARCNGGSDHLNNLYPACINCNLEKATYSTRTIRWKNGVVRAPYNKTKKENLKAENTVGGAIVGGGIGWAIGGPIGGFIGGIIGGAIGESSSPQK